MENKSSEHPIPNEPTASPLPAGKSLAELLESYSTHVNSELQSRISVLERERDEARKEREIYRLLLVQVSDTLNLLPSVSHPAITLPTQIVPAIVDLQQCYKDASRARNGDAAPAVKRAQIAESQLSTLREALRKISEIATGGGSRRVAEIELVIERSLTPPTEPQGETK